MRHYDSTDIIKFSYFYAQLVVFIQITQKTAFITAVRLAVHTSRRNVTAVRLFVHGNFGASANISSIFSVFFFRQQIFSRKNANEQHSFSYGSHILTWKMYISIFFVSFLLCKRVSQLWRYNQHNARRVSQLWHYKTHNASESHSCDATKYTMQASLTAVTLQKTQCTAILTAVT